MTAEYLAKEDLEVGELYYCKARNFDVATWNGKVFVYMRYKFGNSFTDTERHWDEGAPYGTVKPLEKIKKPL